MYHIGEILIYGAHGACRVVEHTHSQTDGKPVTYLVLEPLGQTGARYMVPAHNQLAMAKLRPLMTPEELERLPGIAAEQQPQWTQDENRRKLLYRELIGSTDRGRLLAMLMEVCRHKKEQMEKGRKCHICDENFIRDAEKILCGEIGAVLELGPSVAKAWLAERIG